MKKPLLLLIASGVSVVAFGSRVLTAAQGPPSQTPPAAKAAEPKKFQDFNLLTKDSKKYEGFITLHEKEQHLYAEIKPNQLDQPILAPMVIARGTASAGFPLNFGDEWVLVFRRMGDNLQLIRKNIHFTAPAGTPLDKAVKQNYTDSILMALPILSINPAGGALVVDFADIFLTDFAQVGFGSRGPQPVAVVQDPRLPQQRRNPGGGNLQRQPTSAATTTSEGQSPIVDSRGITMVIHYSLCKTPDPGYHPRTADYRVGPLPQCRHRLRPGRPGHRRPTDDQPLATREVRSQGQAFAPEETDRLVDRGQRSGGTIVPTCSKAFSNGTRRSRRSVSSMRSPCGGRTSVTISSQRTSTTAPCGGSRLGSTFAMSGLRSDPMTGEMIDGDVIFDASWIKTWKEEYALLVGVPTPTGTGADSFTGAIPLAMGEVISPIMAMKQGFGPPIPPAGSRRAAALNAALLRGQTTPAPVAWRAGPDGPRRRHLRLGPDSGPPLPPHEPGPVHVVQLRCRQGK